MPDPTDREACERERERLRICLDAANGDIRRLKELIRNTIVILETSSMKGKTKDAALDELFGALDIQTRQPD